jgi:hypothetical protein
MAWKQIQRIGRSFITSSFNIDLDTFLDNSKVKKDEQENKNDNIENDKNIQKGIPDDVFKSGKFFIFYCI